MRIPLKKKNRLRSGSEKPKQTAYRLYELDRKCLRKLRRFYKTEGEQVSESEIVRRAIRELHGSVFDLRLLKGE